MGKRGSFISWGNLEAEAGSKVDAPRGTDCWFMLTLLSGGRKMPDHQKMEQGCVTSRCPQERSRRHSILQKGQTRLAMSKLDVQDQGQPLSKELESRRCGPPSSPPTRRNRAWQKHLRCGSETLCPRLALLDFSPLFYIVSQTWERISCFWERPPSHSQNHCFAFFDKPV